MNTTPVLLAAALFVASLIALSALIQNNAQVPTPDEIPKQPNESSVDAALGPSFYQCKSDEECVLVRPLRDCGKSDCKYVAITRTQEQEFYRLSGEYCARFSGGSMSGGELPPGYCARFAARCVAGHCQTQNSA